jgi:hypothetical protein
MERLEISLLFLFCSSFVCATSGVSPAGYSVDFSPGLTKDFMFNYFFEGDSLIELYVEGPLSNYVSLSETQIQGEGVVVATLSLPSEVNSPGINRIRVGARQLSSNEGGIGILADVGGIITVKVPYPGRYVGLKVIAPNVNKGEIANISVEAHNLGEEKVVLNPMLQVFKEGELVNKVQGNLREIDVGEIIKLSFSLETNNYGEIEDFDIKVTSFFNSVFEEIYADVFFPSKEIYFSTPSAKLRPWSNLTLRGFLDTSLLENGDYWANITVHYGNVSSSELVNVKVYGKIDWGYYVFILIILFMIILLCWRIKLFSKTLKKSKNEE